MQLHKVKRKTALHNLAKRFFEFDKLREVGNRGKQGNSLA